MRSPVVAISRIELPLQRVMGLALGCEDLNDHDQLRHDPLLVLLCRRRDITCHRSVRKARGRSTFAHRNKDLDRNGQGEPS